MDIKKLHYLIILVSYPVIILHLLFGHYTTGKLMSGIVFFSAAFAIYVGFVYLFFKTEKGKIMVAWGLISIAIILILRLFMIT